MKQSFKTGRMLKASILFSILASAAIPNATAAPIATGVDYTVAVRNDGTLFG